MSKRKKRESRRNRRLARQRPGRLPKKMGSVVGHGTSMTMSHDSGCPFPTTPDAIREMLLRRVRR